MINGLGGTPISELYILYRRAHQQLADRGITVGRSYVSEYCTSLDMAGASLTLVKLDDEIEELLAAPAEVPSASSDAHRQGGDRRIVDERDNGVALCRRFGDHPPPFQDHSDESSGRRATRR